MTVEGRSSEANREEIRASIVGDATSVGRCRLDPLQICRHRQNTCREKLPKWALGCGTHCGRPSSRPALRIPLFPQFAGASVRINGRGWPTQVGLRDQERITGPSSATCAARRLQRLPLDRRSGTSARCDAGAAVSFDVSSAGRAARLLRLRSGSAGRARGGGDPRGSGRCGARRPGARRLPCPRARTRSARAPATGGD